MSTEQGSGFTKAGPSHRNRSDERAVDKIQFEESMKNTNVRKTDSISLYKSLGNIYDIKIIIWHFSGSLRMYFIYEYFQAKINRLFFIT